MTAGPQRTTRLDAGVSVAAVGALVLLVSLFLDWFGDEREAASAWTLFEVIDLALAAIALLALSTFLSRNGFAPRLPQGPLVLLGAAALVLTASQLIDHPPAVAFSEVDPQTGAWLALAGALLLIGGAFMSIARVSFSVEQREQPPDPETETVKMTPPDRPV